LELGEIYLLAGDWDQSRDWFDNLIRKKPFCTEAYFGMARSYSGLGEPELALEAYREAAGKNPGDPTVLVQLGNAYLDQLMLTDARQVYQAALNLTPGNIDAILGLERTQFLSDDDSAPGEWQIQIPAFSPDDLARYALNMQEMSKWQEADEYIQQALTKDPYNPLAWLAKGYQHTHSGDLEQAEDSFTTSLTNSPKCIECHLALGSIHLIRGGFDKAEIVYQELIRRQPARIDGYLALSNLYIEQDELNKAEAILQSAIKAIPADADLYESLARLYIEKGESDQAFEIGEQGLKVVPGAAKLFVVRGDIASEEFFRVNEEYQQLQGAAWWYHYVITEIQSKANTSTRFYQKVTSQKLKQLKSAYRLALAKVDTGEQSIIDLQGKMDQAKDDYQYALSLDPGNERALTGLARTEIAQGQVEAGIQHLQKALDVNPQSTMAHNSLGFTYLTYGSPEASLDLFEKSLIIDPQQPFALLGKFKSLIAMNRWGAEESVRITASGQFWWENLISQLRTMTGVSQSVPLGHAYHSKDWDSFETMIISLPKSWDASKSEFDKSQVLTYLSPDRQAAIQSIIYDDGLPINNEIAGKFVLALINESYGNGLIVIKDEYALGWENLTWISSDGHYQGVTAFSKRGETLFILTYVYSTADEDRYLPELEETMNQVQMQLATSYHE
jgi:tetratricopeptide (TPR) repeat protein